MTFTIPFTYPYLDEIPLEPEWPAGFPMGYTALLGGEPFVLDTSFEAYRRQSTRHTSLESTREAIDFTNIPGEGTISTDLPWRRSVDDWLLGSGQIYLDKKKSAPNRFYRSKGIYPWLQWQATLLPATCLVAYIPIGGCNAIAAGRYVYILTDTTVFFTSEWNNSFTYLTGLPGSGYKSICTDGSNIYIACDSGGVYSAPIGAAAVTQYTTGTVQTVAFVGDRLMAANGPNLWNITGSGQTLVTTTGAILPNVSPLLTNPSVDWVWNCFCYGSSQIYIGGAAGNQMSGAIYRTTAEPDGTALTVPVLALPLENGEKPYALHSYLNFVFVGTDLGVRMCETLAAYDPTGNQGDLRSGPLIPNLTQPLTAPCHGITGNNRWIFFAWSYYDSENSGLGRADVSNFIDTLAPAYASDLMVPPGQIDYLDWDPITNGPLISVQGYGVYVQADTLVAQGTIDSGPVGYDIPDDKICEFFSLRTTAEQQEGDVLVSIGIDGAPPTIAGAQYGAQGVTGSKFPLGQVRGELIDVVLTLRANASLTGGPVLGRWTLEAIPGVAAPTGISAVFILHHMVVGDDGTEMEQDVYAKLAFLENLRLTQQVVTYQEGLDYSVQVVVTEVDFLPNKAQGTERGGFDAYAIVFLKTIEVT